MAGGCKPPGNTPEGVSSRAVAIASWGKVSTEPGCKARNSRRVILRRHKTAFSSTGAARTASARLRPPAGLGATWPKAA